MIADQLKYNSWMVTILAEGLSDRLPTAENIESTFNELSSYWLFQQEYHENSETKGKLHYQCAMKTHIRMRKPTLLKKLSTLLNHPQERIRVDSMQGTWEQAKQYCTKEDTRVDNPGTQRSSQTIKAEESLKYDFSDISFLQEEKNRFPWQSELLKVFFNMKEKTMTLQKPDSRAIYWVTDKEGNCGKSSLVKYICAYNPHITAKLSFATANQLRSSLTTLGPRQLYIIDIPRTLGADDSINDLLSAIEDLKNGFVVSSFYGQYNQLIMLPPHVVIFSNSDCPIDKLSGDRWQLYRIHKRSLISESLPKNKYKDIFS